MSTKNKHIHKRKKVRYCPYGKARALVTAKIFLLQNLPFAHFGSLSSIIVHTTHFTNTLTKINYFYAHCSDVREMYHCPVVITLNYF
jgi:hypothetical protein